MTKSSATREGGAKPFCGQPNDAAAHAGDRSGMSSIWTALRRSIRASWNEQVAQTPGGCATANRGRTASGQSPGAGARFRRRRSPRPGWRRSCSAPAPTRRRSPAAVPACSTPRRPPGDQGTHSVSTGIRRLMRKSLYMGIGVMRRARWRLRAHTSRPHPPRAHIAQFVPHLC